MTFVEDLLAARATTVMVQQGDENINSPGMSTGQGQRKRWERGLLRRVGGVRRRDAGCAWRCSPADKLVRERSMTGLGAMPVVMAI